MYKVVGSLSLRNWNREKHCGETVMGRVRLEAEEVERWANDHIREGRYVVFFYRTGLRGAFWVLPATRTWQFVEFVLTKQEDRAKLEQFLKSRGVKFFNAEVDWGLGKVEFWQWKEFKAFCAYYLPDRSYDAYRVYDTEIVLLPRPSTPHLIKFCITLTSANTPEEKPKDFLDQLKVPNYLATEYNWSTFTATAKPVE